MRVIIVLLFVIAVMIYPYTVKVYFQAFKGGMPIVAYVNNTEQFPLQPGYNDLKLSGKVGIKFRPFGGIGWVHPESVVVDSTTTIVVISAMKVADVRIETDPNGAEILLMIGEEEVPLGKTPYTGKLPVGNLNLRFEKSGYHVFETTISLPDEGGYFSFKLVPRDLYTFVTNPIDAELRIDGVEVGTTPISTIVEEGTHTLTFYVEDLEVFKTELRFGGGVRKRLIFNIPTVHDLKVSTVPEGIFVEVDGRLSKSPAIFKVVEGTHIIKCWATGYGVIEKKMEVLEDSEIRCILKPKLAELRFYGIERVRIDGIEVTSREVEIPEGVHLVELIDGNKIWLIYKWFEGKEMIGKPSGMGSVVIPFDRFYLDGREMEGPAVLLLKEGFHTVYSPSGLVMKKFKVRDGEVIVIPEGRGVLFLLSDPEGLRVGVLKGESEIREVSTPEILVGEGEVTLIEFEGCEAGRVLKVRLSRGSYEVVRLCGGGGT